MEIIGSGNVGDKVQKLIDHKSAILEAGFLLPKSLVLAQDTLEEMIGCSLEEAQHQSSLKINEKAISEITQKVLAHFRGEIALAVRSSAKNDSAGTGIYESHFTNMGSDNISTALEKTLLSYYSPQAIAYRDKLSIPHGYGTLIQPIIADPLIAKEGYAGPLLSGNGRVSSDGFESTSSIHFYKGLGGGVDISIPAIKGDIGALIDIAKLEHFNTQHHKLIKMRSNTFDVFENTLIDNIFSNDEFTENFQPEIYRATNHILLEKFYESIHSLREKIGDFYFEFAITNYENPQYFITQIDKINKDYSLENTHTGGEIVVGNGDEITGTGVLQCKRIFFLNSYKDITKLSNYNKKGKAYILICSNDILHNGYLNFSYFSNACAILETSDSKRHENEFSSHFTGINREAKIILAKLPEYDSATIRTVLEGKSCKGSKNIWKGEFTLIANESTQFLELKVSEEENRETSSL